jgi:predicted HTH transcriptional regulator
MDLVEILQRPEGKTLEFKRELSSPDRVLKTIVAFANTAGGTLLIGVEDRTRHVRGIGEPLDVEERIANLVSDGIAPRLVPEIEILPWRRTSVVAVHVYPSPSRPHHLKREGTASGVYVRVGSTNRRADADLIDELRRFSRGEAFDEQPMPDLDSEALDFRVASESFASARALSRRDLETLRLLTSHQGRRRRPSVDCSSSASTASGTFPTRGYRQGDSRAGTRPGLSIRPRFTRCRCVRWKRQSRSSPGTPYMARTSAPYVASNDGAFLRQPRARL